MHSVTVLQEKADTVELFQALLVEKFSRLQRTNIPSEFGETMKAANLKLLNYITCGL